jgi:hypothetical protein
MTRLLTSASLLAAAAQIALGGVHPRLLITSEDLPRLRHACGVSYGPEVAAPTERAGYRAAEFQSLRAHLTGRGGAATLPGELAAIAFLHLVDPADALDAARLWLLEAALRGFPANLVDPVEAVLALDWCWADLPASAREGFLGSLSRVGGTLSPAESPLDHRAFRAKLACLAGAVLFDEEDCALELWADCRQRVLAAARDYFERTFPAFVEWRGLSPTGPAAAGPEESDTAVAVEVACLLGRRDLWQEYRDSVGRWMEHYVYASFVHPVLQHHFLRDDGSLAAVTPAAAWEEMLPVTAHLIACRAQDPAAVLVAQRVEQRLRGQTADPRAVPWQWVPIVLDIRRLARCDYSRLPPARNFGGAVVFRNQSSRAETAIWIEAGQPLLRRRQHADAGHFLVYSNGRLTTGAGDDIAFEAVPSKGGFQRLGHDERPFDFDAFATSTIAHNCLILWDPLRAQSPDTDSTTIIGGQRLVQSMCSDFSSKPENSPRQTARQLAYGYQGTDAYLALDLLPAYDQRQASAYTREFIFAAGRVLVVVDRVTPVRGRAEPIWIINVPSRPTVDGVDLATQSRSEGRTSDAGIWRCDGARRIFWSEADGGLWLISLLPQPRQLRVIGGPAHRLTVPDGPSAGATYVGGDPDGFERLIRPGGRGRPLNAWYRLGKPTLLGPHLPPLWGRIEIEPVQKLQTCVFLTALVVDEADAALDPQAALEQGPDGLRLRLVVGPEQLELVLPAGPEPGGTIVRPSGQTWVLPRQVEADLPLPGD